MFGEQFLVDARFVVESLQMTGGDKLDQVAVSHIVLGDEQEVKRGIAGAGRFFFEARAGRDVRLATEDGFQSVFLGCLVKLDRAMHVSVVGDADGWHSAGFGFLYGVSDPASAIEQAVLGVKVKMDKIGMFHGQ